MIFKDILALSEAECKLATCVMINLSGEIIYHEKFYAALSSTFHSLIPTHVIDYEPKISDKLIANDILQKSECVDVSRIAIQKSYSIDVARLREFPSDVFMRDGFAVRHIAGTNTVLIVKYTNQDDGDNHCTTHSSPMDHCWLVFYPFTNLIQWGTLHMHFYKHVRIFGDESATLHPQTEFAINNRYKYSI